MTLQEIKERYSVDSIGAFGNEKNPMKKHQMRADLKTKNSAELEKVKTEYEKIRELAIQARKIFDVGRSWKQGPAINKAYKDANKAIDRLWAVVEMRGQNIKTNLER